MTLYDDLDIPKDATADEIKEAYKKKAMETHPDKGGDAEKFGIVKHAYDILSDEKKRDYYDKTGQEQKIQPFDLKFTEFVRRYILQIAVIGDNFKHSDMVREFIGVVQECEIQASSNLRKVRKEMENVDKMDNLISRLSDSDNNILKNTLTAEAVNARQGITQQEKNWADELLFLAKAKDIISAHDYKFEERPRETEPKNKKWESINLTDTGFFVP